MSSNSTTKTTAARKAGNRKFATKTGSRNATILKRVVTMRGKNNSWATIAAALEIAPRTARRIYDEAAGEKGAHHGLLPGKGGRRPVNV